MKDHGAENIREQELKGLLLIDKLGEKQRKQKGEMDDDTGSCFRRGAPGTLSRTLVPERGKGAAILREF